MTVRERFLAVLKGERPDRMPWFADLNYLYAHYGANRRAGLRQSGPPLALRADVL